MKDVTLKHVFSLQHTLKTYALHMKPEAKRVTCLIPFGTCHEKHQSNVVNLNLAFLISILDHRLVPALAVSSAAHSDISSTLVQSLAARSPFSSTKS